MLDKYDYFQKYFKFFYKLINLKNLFNHIQIYIKKTIQTNKMLEFVKVILIKI